jgi:FkbM family methyltransferase
MKSALIFVYIRLTRLLSGSGLYRFAVLKRINKLLLRRLKSKKVFVNGGVLHLDRNDSLNLSIYSTFEPFETEFFRNNIKPSATILDVGANIGYYTLLFSKLAGNDGKVIAFEPDRENFVTLSKNISSNKLQNVVAVEAAVTNSNGSIRLYHSKDKGDQRIYDSGDGRKYYDVKAFALDDYLRKSDELEIDWVKIDIQGAEGYAIEGMKNVIKSNKGIRIICEFWPMGIERSGYGVNKFFDLIDELQLEYRELNESKQVIEETSKAALLNRYSVTSKKFTNLILSSQR